MQQLSTPTRRGFLARTSTMAAVIVAPRIFIEHAGAADPSPRTETWQIGCFTRPWEQFDYRTALDAMVEAGFHFAGLMTARGGLVISLSTTPEQIDQIGREIRNRELKLLCMYAGEFPVHKSLEEGISGLRKLIDDCEALQSASLMVVGTTDAALYNRYYKAVTECCPYAAEKHVGLVLKPHGGLNGTGPQCRKAIEQVGHKNFTLWYDPGNVLFYSDGRLNPVQDAAAVAGLISGLCVKDFSMSTEGGKPVKEVFVNPGDGKVDFPSLMAVLKKGGFSGGPLLIETLAHGSQEVVLAEAKKARAFIEKLVSADVRT